jgi:hypothetical protein
METPGYHEAKHTLRSLTPTELNRFENATGKHHLHRDMARIVQLAWHLQPQPNKSNDEAL